MNINEELLAYQRKRLEICHLSQDELVRTHRSAITANQSVSSDTEMNQLKSIVSNYRTSQYIDDFIRIKDTCSDILQNTVLTHPARVDMYIKLLKLAEWRIMLMREGIDIHQIISQ
jgi:hypothetical protein